MLSRFPWFHNYPSRKLEWLLALYTVWFGLWIIMPWEAMNTTSFASSIRFAPEWVWGAAYIVVGIAHNVALHVNGRGWWTPFVRTAALFMNMNVFLALTLGVFSVNPGGTGVATYSFVVFGFCGAAMFTAAHDCGRELKIWRRRRDAF